MAPFISDQHLVFDFIDEHDVPRSLGFSRPVEIITTSSLSKVTSCLREVQRGVDHGLYAAGYLSYEAAQALDPSLTVQPGTEMPLIWFGLFTKPSLALHEPLESFQLSPWESSISRSRYDAGIGSVRDAIECGDAYQVNYTLRLRARFEGNDYMFYRHLVAAQRARYCAYLNLGRYRILSISPELFFHRQGSRIIARPMKGTMKRGRWLEEDEMFGAQLRGSEKNRAENVMIVDLVRNDLGRIAETGSVQVTRLFEIERYSTLWQMTSTIEATLREGCTLEEIFTALFPSGSVTGAPKTSTMKIISGLEDSPRGVYCGAVGFVRPDQQATFNVAIRTVVIDSELGTAQYGIGGGITWDSTAADEYQEALNKAAVLAVSGAEFELLETMRLENGSFALLERHLKRLQSSAKYFEFSFSPESAKQELEVFASAVAGEMLRVRLLLSRNGRLRVESQPLEAFPVGLVPVKIASRPISRDRIFLYHKTTERSVFDELTAEFPEVHDVLLWNEEREVTEFTTGNLIAKLNGELITPARACGLLAGTLRAQLIDDGLISERVLKLSELSLASALWLINSVRGWVPVRLERET